jgi:hypothetical protein
MATVVGFINAIGITRVSALYPRIRKAAPRQRIQDAGGRERILAAKRCDRIRDTVERERVLVARPRVRTTESDRQDEE